MKINKHILLRGNSLVQIPSDFWNSTNLEEREKREYYGGSYELAALFGRVIFERGVPLCGEMASKRKISLEF